MLPSHVPDCHVTTQQFAWLFQHCSWKFHNGTYSSWWWLILSKLVCSWKTSHSRIPSSWAIVQFSWANRRTHFHIYIFWAHLWLFLVCSNTSFITTEPADIVSLVDVKANLLLLPLEVISFRHSPCLLTPSQYSQMHVLISCQFWMLTHPSMILLI